MSRAPEQSKRKWIFSRQASVVFLVLVLLAVLALSLTPHPESILGRFNLYDKAGHFAAYVFLSFFAVRSIGRRGVLPFALAIAACTALGGLIELIQPLVGRNMELGDFLVDLGGSILGSVLAWVVSWMARGRVEKVL